MEKRFKFLNFIESFKEYSKNNSIIIASLLVGSYARGSEKEDSDIDIVIITNKKEEMLTSDFYKAFDAIVSYNTEYYGACTSIRVFYANGLEVEFGIVEESWMNKPLDEGTKKVLSDGYLVLIDKKAYF